MIYKFGYVHRIAFGYVNAVFYKIDYVHRIAVIDKDFYKSSSSG